MIAIMAVINTSIVLHNCHLFLSMEPLDFSYFLAFNIW